MRDRRELLLVLSSVLPSLAFPRSTFGQTTEPSEPEIDAGVPEAEGLADFSNAWTTDVKESPQLFALEPDIPPGTAELFKDILFRSAAEIDAYFETTVGSTYNDWFNARFAGKGTWAYKAIGERGVTKAQIAANFANFWNNFLSTRPVSLVEFIAYMSVFINECGGNLVSHTERFGDKDHPGISYLFDRVVRIQNGKTWSKMSYNTGALNKSAFALFNDPKFNTAHGDKALSALLRNTTDRVWQGDDYPDGQFPTDGKILTSGFLLEADFFKFRGRGLIQTTWRANYKSLVQFVQSYSGTNSKVSEFRNKWTGLTVDDVCTVSSNADWDDIFTEPGQLVLCHAIVKHADDGKYFPLERKSTTLLNGSVGTSGSLGHMGLKIGGSIGYAATLKGRVRDVCVELVKAHKARLA